MQKYKSTHNETTYNVPVFHIEVNVNLNQLLYSIILLYECMFPWAKHHLLAYFVSLIVCTKENGRG